MEFKAVARGVAGILKVGGQLSGDVTLKGK